MTKKLKLSQWHDGNVKPVHVGIYERQYHYNTMLNYWNGESWRWPADGYLMAWTLRHELSSSQTLPWRGIVK